MELKEYWEIVWPRWWIVVSVVILAILSNLVFAWQFSPPYQATVRLAVKPQLEPRTEQFYGYDEYYAYVASEFLVDDIIQIIESNAFHNDLGARLQGKLAGKTLGSIEAKKAHRVMTVNVTTGSREDALLIAQAIGDVLSEKGSKYFSSISQQNPEVRVVDPPSVFQVGENRRTLDLALRAVLGLIVGIGIVFLLDYLSDTLRGAAHVENALGLPVLGEIPRETRQMRERSTMRVPRSSWGSEA